MVQNKIQMDGHSLEMMSLLSLQDVITPLPLILVRILLFHQMADQGVFFWILTSGRARYTNGADVFVSDDGNVAIFTYRGIGDCEQPGDECSLFSPRIVNTRISYRLSDSSATEATVGSNNTDAMKAKREKDFDFVGILPFNEENHDDGSPNPAYTEEKQEGKTIKSP
mmetsp:Transcript_20025/g.36169  ORF Transcript_20025/g.36169 Transcript_20025/m.36169 type:complete len:168 (-) Transcript_20025:134-637(-)